MQVTLKRLAVCSCGFTFLNDDVPLGTVFNIHPEIKDTAVLTCGQCGKKTDVTCVFADARVAGMQGGFLPEVIFQEPMGIAGN